MKTAPTPNATPGAALLAVLALSVPLSAPAAQAPAGLCAAMPRAEAERAIGFRAFGADALDDRLGIHRRQLCRYQTEPGETLELTVWTRADRRPMPPLPARAEYCDVGCLRSGREPNLYLYQQRRIGAALCVVRRPRPDRDLDSGPITACSLGGPAHVMLSVTRRNGIAATPMTIVKALLDRAAASLRRR